MISFRNPALKQLTDQQVRFAPPARRWEQIVRAERLLDELEPSKLYPYQYVCFRVTDYRPDSYPDLIIPGDDLKHDLFLFMDEVSRSLPALPVEEVAEPVLTLEEVSQRLKVSPKTISRWRECGLIGRRVVCNGRRQLAFPQALVEKFVAANATRVERGSRFTHLSELEKDEILRRAKRLSCVSCGNLTEVSRRIARRLGRSIETVRYTIKNFDRTHPEQALFPKVTGSLDEQAKHFIYNSYHRGLTVETLAKRYDRTRTSVYRVLNEVRAQRLLSQPLDYIDNPTFAQPGIEREILASMPCAEEFEAKRRELRIPKDVPPELAPLYEMPLLNKEQEQHVFRQMNFLKYKAAKMRERLDPTKARKQDLDQIEALQSQANTLKDQLVTCNMRLVVSIAKRHAGQADNFFELLSDGNMSLLRAVEKFDYSRGNKFSTYASWAIMKNFARSIPEERHRRERYVTGHEEMFEMAPDVRTDEQECLATAEQGAHKVNRLLEYLDPRERQIVRMRAGLDNHAEGMTLEEIGLQLGITKERVRQLNVRIMNKLRNIAKEQKMDMM